MGDESNRAETLQFWIDAQLPPALAQWLQRAHGTEARHVEDLGLHRAEDTKIFTEARATQRPAGVSIDDRHPSADALAVGVAFHFEP